MLKKFNIFHKLLIIVVGAFIVVAFTLGGCDDNDSPPLSRVSSWFCWLQNIDPLTVSTAEFDLGVLDYSKDGTEDGEFTSVEMYKMKLYGKILLSYLSIGEAENYRYYWNTAWDENPPDWLGEENSEWPGNYAVRYWYEDWQRLILGYLDRIIDEGFDGVYLDKVDEFEFWADKESATPESWYAVEMVNFVKRIADYVRARKKNFIVVIQNAERILDYSADLLKVIDGWAVEDLFYTELQENASDYIAERLNYLFRVKEVGKPVLVIDYVDDGSGFTGDNANRITNFVSKCREYGFIPYAAYKDRALNKIDFIVNLVK